MAAWIGRGAHRAAVDSAAAPPTKPRRPRGPLMLSPPLLGRPRAAFALTAALATLAAAPAALTAVALRQELVQLGLLLGLELGGHLLDGAQVLLLLLGAQHPHLVDQRVELRHVERRLLQLGRHRFPNLAD